MGKAEDIYFAQRAANEARRSAARARMDRAAEQRSIELVKEIKKEISMALARLESRGYQGGSLKVLREYVKSKRSRPNVKTVYESVGYSNIKRYYVEQELVAWHIATVHIVPKDSDENPYDRNFYLFSNGEIAVEGKVIYGSKFAHVAAFGPYSSTPGLPLTLLLEGIKKLGK